VLMDGFDGSLEGCFVWWNPNLVLGWWFGWMSCWCLMVELI